MLSPRGHLYSISQLQQFVLPVGSLSGIMLPMAGPKIKPNQINTFISTVLAAAMRLAQYLRNIANHRGISHSQDCIYFCLSHFF